MVVIIEHLVISRKGTECAETGELHQYRRLEHNYICGKQYGTIRINQGVPRPPLIGFY